ncbi:hypothetical protein BV22DRAFT_888415 [Leucogyrophana mollusca]|uniref:Uncharacterized protein n=1 Tax=Leucogyrophana mollusca TaxID=85980 RepID=A0ACB8B064_9AGAM|nr:hypothetical protein BV22DRAFT_888415 [Leucogyrophana mollusca]
MDRHAAPDRCAREEGMRCNSIPPPSFVFQLPLHFFRRVPPVFEGHSGAGKANLESKHVARTCYFEASPTQARPQLCLRPSPAPTRPQSSPLCGARTGGACTVVYLPSSTMATRRICLLLLAHSHVGTQRRQ